MKLKKGGHNLAINYDFHGMSLEDAEAFWWRLHVQFTEKTQVELITGHGVIRRRFLALAKERGVECAQKLGNSGSLVAIFGGHPIKHNRKR